MLPQRPGLDASWSERMPSTPSTDTSGSSIWCVRTPAAIGHMCLLWLWALDNAPDGDLSALPAKQLAEICQYAGHRTGDLAAALRTSGFVDADGRLHDWGDYTGRLIDQRAASRERQRRRRARLRAAMEESKEDGT